MYAHIQNPNIITQFIPENAPFILAGIAYRADWLARSTFDEKMNRGVVEVEQTAEGYKTKATGVALVLAKDVSTDPKTVALSATTTQTNY